MFVSFLIKICSIFYSDSFVSNDGSCVFFFQAEDGIRYLVRSRGLGDVYKRQVYRTDLFEDPELQAAYEAEFGEALEVPTSVEDYVCLLYTSDAADERSSVDLGGSRIIKKKKDADLSKQTHIKQKHVTKKQHTAI